jgi:hypothetical protein
VSLFIVTHKPDAEWLKYCLASIQKFATGFHEVIVVVPHSEKDDTMDVVMSVGKPLGKVKFESFDQAPPPLGHLHHCAIKCMADKFTTGDYVLFLDSDCVFKEPVTPEDYFVDAKPVLLMESYQSLRAKKDGAVQWQEGTEKALGFKPSHETMRRHPAVHHRSLFANLLYHIEKLQGMTFMNYVFAQKPTFPCGYNDFNVIGAFAVQFFSGDYHLIDVGLHPEQRPPDKLIQWWSHGGLDKPQDVWIDGQKINLVPKTKIEKLLNVSDCGRSA